MNFIPDQTNEIIEVPFYEDVKSEGGWQGHETEKSMHTLQAEITQAFSRLGGMVTGFQRGAFGERAGFRVHYTVTRSDGKLWPGRMDVAALPVKPPAKDEKRYHNAFDKRLERSLKMALYMTRNALDGSWFLQQLSPGFIPLMPWMLVPGEDGKNFTELMTERNLLELPAGDEIVEGDFEESNGQ